MYVRLVNVLAINEVLGMLLMNLTTFPVKSCHRLPLITTDMMITVIACMSTGHGTCI